MCQYNSQDKNGKPVRKIAGCMWYTYTDAAGGEVTFHTCPFLGDSVSFISAGISAAHSELNILDSSIEAFRTVFNGKCCYYCSARDSQTMMELTSTLRVIGRSDTTRARRAFGSQ
jgi:hypothetical protein